MRYFADSERSLGKIFRASCGTTALASFDDSEKHLQPAKEGDTGTRKSGLNEQGRNIGLRSGEL
jgi:hypothetical protein